MSLPALNPLRVTRPRPALGADPVGRVLRSRLVAALAAPHGVDRYLEQVNPMWAAHEVRARIVSVTRETGPDALGAPVATLTLQPTSTWRGHRAGQHVLVGVEVPGSARRLTRAFSISSPASVPGESITLTVRSHPEGEVSQHLVEHARPGDVLHLSQAQGSFCLDESPATPTNNHLLFITGGSGITPAMSMLRTLLRDGYDGHVGRRVTFLHYARSEADQIFAEELAAIAAADNGVAVHLRHGDARFSEFELRRLVPRFAGTDTWLCGPAGLVELVTDAYRGSPRLRTEFFKPAVARAAGGAGEQVDGTVAFTRSGLSAPATGDSLLEQAEAAGLAPEHGCRMGICFSCTTTKYAGTVRNLLTGEESAQPDEEIRICVNRPVGDCHVDL
ncbi:iron-sulfur cluster-binding domain-containing protein [Nocardioides sp. GY 10113]|uniref:flavin reductase family protein n=1 Tax=Nocardioides sp. GY 10113 TaxID=2569761 RepID=UPI0010A8B661|nr:iron-sulfur cluster-binding domain-containing protein [Nocardioides sp. GY 10113]TIC88793.1 iron-sulfur cluster-binding domain-containing protein [Nocardioides sp. GY 10113]